ncbi:MAG: hypothetical protein JWR07_4419 [Nevskia sp.]|nr:hypothetical protein [Nevskia sp.]
MPEILRNLNHRTWLLLTLATAATFSVRVDGLAGFVAGFATVAIACFKGRLVILDFMELRHAPRIWRAVIEGWLLLVSLLVLAVYWYSTTRNGGA